jgi:hypothetical protein
MSDLQERLDEARRQIRDRDKRLDRIRVILGAAAAETVEEVAERVISERNASWEKAVDVRDTLGAKPGEKFLDAARRVVAERDEARADISAARDILGTPPGETLRAAVTRLRDQSDLATRSGHSLADQLEAVRDALGVVAGDVVDAAQRVADAARRADFSEAERETFAATFFAELRTILGAADGQPLTVRARDLMVELHYLREAVEGTPTMVFEAGISVTVGRDSFGNQEYAQVRVSHITDPLFMSLSGGQLSRLALCLVRKAVS